MSKRTFSNIKIFNEGPKAIIAKEKEEIKRSFR